MRKKKIDLHVHTPASYDYKGSKDDKEYLDILTKCSEDSIDTIAVTDHNTIDGYRKLLKIRDSIKIVLSNAATTNAPQEYIESLKKDYSLFKTINIIPGVELSVYPKLHIIILFSEEIELSDIDKFLHDECGIKNDSNSENVPHLIQKTPTELLDIAYRKFNKNIMILLPHIDSSNGAWNELSGTARSEVLASCHINCCQILNLETKNVINSILKNREYAKCKNITYIQASDFHGAEGSRPGAQHTIFESDNVLNFTNLKTLMNSQTPELSSEKIDARHKEFIQNKGLIQIELTNEIAIDSDELNIAICKKLCSFLNTDNSLFQINLYNTKQDYSKAVEETMELLKDKVYAKLDPPLPVSCRVLDFSFSSSKKRILIQIMSRKNLYQFEGKVYIKDGDLDRVASSSEIESIVIRNSYNTFYKRKELFLSRRVHDISIVSKSFYSQSLRYRITNNLKTIDFGKKIEGVLLPNINEEIERLAIKQANGVTDGNCYIINHMETVEGGRFKEQKSYLRLTCPQYNYASDISQVENPRITQQNSIIITTGGGVYIVNKSLHLFTSEPSFEFSLEDTDEFDFDILLGLSAYLKSNFLLWYLLMFHETDDLFELFLRKKPIIPIPSDKILLKTLSVFASNIRNDEIKFIKKLNKIQTKENKSETLHLVNSHNNSCAGQLQLIEKEIMKYYGLPVDDVRHIISSLDSLGYYTYKLDEDFDNIFT